MGEGGVGPGVVLLKFNKYIKRSNHETMKCKSKRSNHKTNYPGNISVLKLTIFKQ